MAVGLVSFSSTSRAEQHLGGVVRKSQETAGSTRGRKTRIRDPNDKIIGFGTFWSSNPEIFAYRIGRIVGLIHGPPGQVKPFFAALP